MCLCDSERRQLHTYASVFIHVSVVWLCVHRCLCEHMCGHVDVAVPFPSLGL